jgi:hypothetical protein
MDKWKRVEYALTLAIDGYIDWNIKTNNNVTTAGNKTVLVYLLQYLKQIIIIRSLHII